MKEAEHREYSNLSEHRQSIKAGPKWVIQISYSSTNHGTNYTHMPIHTQFGILHVCMYTRNYTE